MLTPVTANAAAAKVPAKATKQTKKGVEEIYQKKTQLEHILLRPDTYIGSVEAITQPMFVYDETTQGIVSRPITYVPGLYKIFDEILVNAADNKVRRLWQHRPWVEHGHGAMDRSYVPWCRFAMRPCPN